MIRHLLILIIALAAGLGSLVAAASTAQRRDVDLRGYVNPLATTELPFRVPRPGVNVELTQYGDEELDEQLGRMAAAGFTWVRQSFRWDEIEPAPGEYDWQRWDVIVEAVARHPELELVAVLVNAPAWAVDRRDSAIIPATPPDDPRYFGDFARNLAARYGDRIDVYQIWDEPNLTTGWGGREPRAADYLALLRAGYHAIHSADADATVIAAGLAPTTEQGPLNISDWRYLEDLYALGAADSMDAVAGKPYGFDASPDERLVDEGTLNFSRFVRLREIMVAHGDGDKALWASHWGWNSLPDDWAGKPSIWGSVSATGQIEYTLAALNRAEREWPWLGGMILHHWQPDAPPDDPVWGFALLDPDGNPKPLLEALAAREQRGASNGHFPAANAHARYTGVWTFGPLGADIGWIQDSRFEFTFEGSDVGLLLREDDYVAYLYPTVDGQPANALPKDANGNAYIVLTSGSLSPEFNLVPVATGLDSGAHTLSVVADRGSDRWALAGFAVSDGDLAEPYERQIRLALVSAAVAGLAAAVSAMALDWSRLLRPLAGLGRRLSDAAQIALGALTSVLLLAGMLLTWGDTTPNLFRREPAQLLLAILSAGLIYVEPGLILTVVAALLLFILFFNRPDIGLALVIFYAPFFLFPVELYQFAFPMSELLLLLLGPAWALNMLVGWARARRTGTPRRSGWPVLTSMDYALAVWLALGFVTLLWTERRGPAITELRTMIVEPALFYLIFRTSRLDSKAVLRVVDALLLAGIVVAVIGLFLYAQGVNVITAEAGARRLASVYGSPNNVALILGRCLPFALAFALAGIDARRRAAAAFAIVVMLVAAILTQSAGALFLGLPVAIVAVLLLTLRRRALIPLAVLAAAGAVAIAVALRSARFARLLDPSEGTNFFRLRVWQSAVQMLKDRPLTGLGLDQFLYEFRGVYIAPDAWQEPNLSHPHNILLDVWTRMSILGLAVLVWMQAQFWRGTAAAYRRFRGQNDLLLAITIGAMGSMCNLLAHGLVDNSIFVNDLSLVFALLLGLAVWLPRAPAATDHE